GLMIGRGAQGRPWIFREIAHYLATGQTCAEPHPAEVAEILSGPLRARNAFSAEYKGVGGAPKHLGWNARDGQENAAFRRVANQAETAAEQLRLTRNYFAALQIGLARVA